jgi:hypothetical protein
MTDERQSFVDTLSMGVTAWDAWQSKVDSSDPVTRTKARMERRAIEQRVADILACNPIEVTRMLVTMWRALEREELLHRTESRLDMIDSSIDGIYDQLSDQGDGMDA